MNKYEITVKTKTGRLARTVIFADDAGTALELAVDLFGVSRVLSNPKRMSE